MLRRSRPSGPTFWILSLGRRAQARTALALEVGALVGLAVLASAQAPSPPDRPRVISPESATFISPPALPALRAAWLVGAEAEAGPYALRVRLREGARIPSHTHPDSRHTLVLTGTLYVGFGERFDERALVPVRAGEVYVAPAGVAHHAWARDGDVEYQENGQGPTATRFVGATDELRNASDRGSDG